MKIDPLPPWRRQAVENLNRHFNERAVTNAHLDQAYARKRAIAADVIAGKPAPSNFESEAKLRQMSTTDLARLILSKPDTIAEREMERQTQKHAIETASAAELRAMLNL